MFTKFMLLPPRALSFTSISPLPPPVTPFFSKSSFINSLRSTSTAAAAAATASLSTTFDETLPYGPSLSKGHKPSIEPKSLQQQDNADLLFDEDSFIRVFDISAIRVPSDRCFDLESRLRGHLLNWPRIRNIARVPGDEIDDELQRYFNSNDRESLVPLDRPTYGKAEGDGIDGLVQRYFNPNDRECLVSLNRRIYGKAEGDGEPLSPVLYRDKLAKTFNSRGYEKFRNLAKLSRPKRKTKKEQRKITEKKKNNESFLVEIVEDDQTDEDEDDMSGLIGDKENRWRKWRGSTRLLLLDERYAFKLFDELPESVKAVLKEDDGLVELVRCKLTLFYSYWQMNEILEMLLPEGMIVPSSFETVGHIIHLNLRDEHLPYKNLIAKVVLDKNKPKIQTVVNKVDAIDNNFRTMQLEVLAGNHSLVTTVVENGLRFNVDLATVYWCSKLGTERQRLVNCFTRSDVVCDVFAGVGPLAIAAAKKVKHVYANDLNPHAVDYLERNCVLNKLERKVEVFNMDGRRFIDAIFKSQKSRPITQVVMNLPKDAAEFLDVFRGIFRDIDTDKFFTLPRIHVYGFSKAQDPEFDFHERIRIALSEVAFEVEMRKVRLVAPGKWMLCASFILPERVAFAKPISYL